MAPRQLLLLFSLGFLGVSSAAAQTRSEDPRQDAKIHFGGFYLKPAVALKELGIDTNVFNESGTSRKDFTFTLTPQLTTSVPFARRGLLQGFTAADVVYYQRYDTERALNPQLSLRGEVYFNRIALYAQSSYLRTRERPNFEIDKRALRTEEGTSAGVQVRVLPKLTVETSVRQLTTLYDTDETLSGASLSEALNRDSLTFGGTARWARTPFTTVVVKGERIRDRFLGSPIRNGDSARVMAGVELNPRALISGVALIGMRRFTPLDPTVPEFTGLVSSGAVTYTLLGSTSFGFTMDRDINYSFEPNQPYYLATHWGANVRRHLVGRFDAIVGFDRHHLAYRDLKTSPSDSDSERRKETTDSYSGSIGYQVGQASRFGVGVAYWMRRSDGFASRAYDGLRIRTTFTSGL